ncbi:MAG: efflux transporter outer membrane subunit [Chthoniobacteraceae bacterium]
MKLKHLPIFAPCAALLLLQACAVGPNYHKPAVQTPSVFKEIPKGWKIAEPCNGAGRNPWWKVYGDPLLDTLVPQVAINNQNLKAYEAAYREALAVVRESRSSLFPSISASPGVTRAYSSRTTTTTQSTEGSASWEIDLWGKVRRQIESDQASAQATAAELADLTLSAQAELVTDYFELRYQDALARLLNDTVAAYERSLKITQNQFEAGVVARSDVITAETQVATTRASAIAAGKLRAQYEHAIALLIGKAPAELTIHPGELAKTVPDIPTMLPSALLERRPDIAEAERKMQQQNALIGVAVAAFYPSISLSAIAGYSGTPSLFSAANKVWSLAASSSMTLIDGGGRSATVAAARASYDQSVANYRQTVLSAFRGVEDELSNLRIMKSQAEAQADAVQLSRQAVAISLNEYQAGTVTYTTVVTAQATALSNEESALEIQQNRMVASASLIKALGGGWTASRLLGKNPL